jgi:hypothetical protein
VVELPGTGAELKGLGEGKKAWVLRDCCGFLLLDLGIELIPKYWSI